MILEIKNLVKTFPGVKALQGVNLQLEAGEIHALLGENGAGKSTVIKVLTGIFPKDSGTITYQGKPFEVSSPQESEQNGISTVYQEVNLLPNLTVAENLFMERQPKTLGIIKWKEINQKSVEILKKFELNIDVTRELGEYSIAVQQMIAIARALELNSKILILDEPTSSLNQEEVDMLFKQMKRLKEEGHAIVFVTHFLDQVYEVCDKITVLRNGEYVGMWPIEDLPRPQLVGKLVGKDLEELDAIGKEHSEIKDIEKEEYIQMHSMKSGEKLGPYDLKIHTGEVVGLAGLLGSGRTELTDLLFGITKADGGHMTIKKQTAVIKNPRFAIKNHFALCPEDRKEQGIIGELSIRENIILALQVKRGWFSLVGRKEQEKYADEYIKHFSIKCSSMEQKINTLSGGNQQKVILARWIASDPSLLMVDEPTRGIDIGAKTEIQKFIIKLSQKGVSVVFISSELDEIIRCSDTVAILHDAQITNTLRGADINEKRIMHEIAGGIE